MEGISGVLWTYREFVLAVSKAQTSLLVVRLRETGLPHLQRHGTQGESFYGLLEPKVKH